MIVYTSIYANKFITDDLPKVTAHSIAVLMTAFIEEILNYRRSINKCINKFNQIQK